MKRKAFIVVLFMHLALLALPMLTAAAVPPYAKWGQIAVLETMKKYNASIIDYLHVGKTQISEHITEEKFKLWVRSNQEEYGVYVMIKFNTSTEQIISIDFTTTNH